MCAATSISKSHSLFPCSEIDKTLESMSSYRKNKWIVEGRLRRLKTALAKRTGRPEVEMQGLEESLGRRRSSRIMEETSGMEEEEEEENAAAVHGRRGRRDGEVLAPDQGKWEWENGL